MPFTRTQLNSPAFLKSLIERRREVRATLSQVEGTNIHSTASFFYDRPGDGLKSTQQLNVDWSRFENHTFFNSAEAKVNVAFDRIINHFPFDGTKQDLETFFEGITGFERWVYDRFPKNVGYLNFSGSSGPSGGGTYVSTTGIAGGLYPDLSSDKTGVNVLDPGLRSFAIESQVYIPSQSNGMEVLFQKLSGKQNGFSMYLVATGSQEQCLATFAVVSGSESLFTTAMLQKKQFNHVCAVFDRGPKKNTTQLYVNARLVAESTSSYAFGDLGSAAVPLVIGSGSAIIVNGITLVPTETLSASLDEFRFYHETRTADQLRAYAKKSLPTFPGLKLYFKFNEPSGSLISTSTVADNGLIIDSSGNELHSIISNFAYSLRSTGSIPSPLTYEKLATSPVLFPAFTNTLSLNTSLLVSASDYDINNPNLITKLIPSHYFLDGQISDGLTSPEGTIGDSYSQGTVPGTGKLGAAQLLGSFLYVWAKFFDEMKLFVDAFASVKHIDYNPTNTAPDNFIPLILKSYGFNVPSFFSDATVEQFVDAENIQTDFGTNEHALQFVQNQIQRRILINLLDVIKSKGTVHSIKSFIRSVGIDPDNSFRIREFGGPNRQQLQHSRENKTQPHLVLDLRDRTGYAITPPLSGGRTEVGFPEPAFGSAFTKKSLYPPHGISALASDGLLTSGSFTFEGLYRYPVGFQLRPLTTQSLMRMVVTGTNFSSVSDGWGTVVNIVATSCSSDIDIPAIRAYVRPCANTVFSPPLLVMQITGTNIFDGNKWNVCFGRSRNDEIGSYVSSSYFLRLGRQDGEQIVESRVTSSYFDENGPYTMSPIFASMDTSLNSSGSYVVIGNRAVSSGVSGTYHFLNDTTNVTNAEARVGTFEGQVSMLRFWSKAIDDTEWREHVRNHKSLGVRHPTQNFNFEHVATGSFGRLRLDVPIEQMIVSASSTGTIDLLDYSQNLMHMKGIGMSSLRRVLLTDIFSYSTISPLFDEAVTDNKVRIRSFQNYENVLESGLAEVAPVYDPNPSEPPLDDTRFSIEFSVIDALNRDIISIFATLEDMDGALGNPELLFSSDYPGLENIRNTYFNRLTSRINLQAFFQYFKWFDSSISSFIEQLIPRKTRFFGTNFVIESHMLERAKLRYFHMDNYLGDTNRIATVRDILVQQLASSIRKF